MAGGLVLVLAGTLGAAQRAAPALISSPSPARLRRAGEGRRPSEVLPRRGKTSAPAKSEPRHPRLEATLLSIDSSDDYGIFREYEEAIILDNSGYFTIRGRWVGACRRAAQARRLFLTQLPSLHGD